MHLIDYSYSIPGNFGINYKLPIWVDDIETDSFNFLLNYSKEIIDKGLNRKDALEDKDKHHWSSYNIFSIQDKNIDSLKEQIIKVYYNFIKELKVNPEKELWINGWVNILTRGYGIKFHRHACHTNSYLSGNIIITESNDATKFIVPSFDENSYYPNDVIDVTNKLGTISMFPQWATHYVEPIQEELRITIGFDLHTKSAMEYCTEHNPDKDLPVKRSVRLI